jgi:hypothetical protein
VVGLKDWANSLQTTPCTCGMERKREKRIDGKRGILKKKKGNGSS